MLFNKRRFLMKGKDSRFDYCCFCFYFGAFQVVVSSQRDFTVVKLASKNFRVFDCQDYAGLKIRSVRSARKIAERFYLEWSLKNETIKV